MNILFFSCSTSNNSKLSENIIPTENIEIHTNNNLKTYLDLRQNGFMNSYLEFYPEMTDEFNGYMKTIHEITNELFRYYQECFVKKTTKHKDLPFIYKPLCFELQKNYIPP